MQELNNIEVNYTEVKPPKRDFWEYFSYKNQQHKYILSLLRQLAWVVPHPKYTSVADMPRFAKWLKSDKAPVRKPILKMNKGELTTTINALESMLYKKSKR